MDGADGEVEAFHPHPNLPPSTGEGIHDWLGELLGEVEPQLTELAEEHDSVPEAMWRLESKSGRTFPPDF